MSPIPYSGEYPEYWDRLAWAIKDSVNWRCVRCGHKHDLDSGHVLTVHHIDGDKANCHWWNLAALCQRCHLKFHHMFIEIPWMFEHSEWFKPYAAGYYAVKYLDEYLPRREVEARLDDLLGLERLA